MPSAYVVAILGREGNSFCADCGAKDPDWACVKHGIFICLDCAGMISYLSVFVIPMRFVKAYIVGWVFTSVLFDLCLWINGTTIRSK